MGLDDGESRHPVQEAMMMGARFSCDAAEALVDRLLDLKEELIREQDEHNHTDNERVDMTERYERACEHIGHLQALYSAVSAVAGDVVDRCESEQGSARCVLPIGHNEHELSSKAPERYFEEHRGGGVQWR